jgi:hypothetical protein
LRTGGGYGMEFPMMTAARTKKGGRVVAARGRLLQRLGVPRKKKLTSLVTSTMPTIPLNPPVDPNRHAGRRAVVPDGDAAPLLLLVVSSSPVVCKGRQWRGRNRNIAHCCVGPRCQSRSCRWFDCVGHNDAVDNNMVAITRPPTPPTIPRPTMSGRWI